MIGVSELLRDRVTGPGRSTTSVTTAVSMVRAVVMIPRSVRFEIFMHTNSHASKQSKAVFHLVL